MDLFWELMGKHVIWLLVGGGLLGVSQQIALVVLPLLADVMQVPYEVLVNWQAGGSFLFLFSSLLWAKRVEKKGCTRVIKLACAGFILSNLLLLFLWVGHTTLSTELMLAVFIVSRVIHGLFSSGIVPQLQVSALHLFPSNSIGALAKVSLGGTLARCLTPIACIGLLLFSPLWVFVLPLILGVFVLLATPALPKFDSQEPKVLKTNQHWSVLFVALLCSFSLCYGQFSLVQVLSKIMTDNSLTVSKWVAVNLTLTACLSTFFQMYYIKKQKVDSENLLVSSLSGALFMALMSSVVSNILAVCVFVALLFVALNSATLAYTNIIISKAGKQFTNYISTIHTVGYAFGALCVNFSLNMPYGLVSIALLTACSVTFYRFLVYVYPARVSSLRKG